MDQDTSLLFNITWNIGGSKAVDSFPDDEIQEKDDEDHGI